MAQGFDGKSVNGGMTCRFWHAARGPKVLRPDIHCIDGCLAIFLGDGISIFGGRHGVDGEMVLIDIASG